MKKLLNQLGIMKSIIQTRLTAIKRNSVDLEFLIPRWSNETHTFVASWREFSPSPKNVSMLTSLVLFGESHAIGVNLSEKIKRGSSFCVSPLEI